MMLINIVGNKLPKTNSVVTYFHTHCVITIALYRKKNYTLKQFFINSVCEKNNNMKEKVMLFVGSDVNLNNMVHFNCKS